ncbi:MAG: hypothetical protein M1820_002857 [Bogoriella megaspora]|nr:MAG: hypothetical protein M1820_002857 [Bogoriella megaspora]
MKFFTVATTFGLAAFAAAQETTPSPSQATKYLEDVVSYLTSLSANPSYESLASVVSTAIPESVQESQSEDVLNAFAGAAATGNGGIPSSYLTASVTYSTQPWETHLNSTLRSQFDALQTSVGVALQSIAVKDLTGSSGASGASRLPENLGWVLGAIAGSAGMIAILL